MNHFDYDRIAEDPDFIKLQQSRNKFIFPLTLFFVIATLLFPILTGYSKALNHIAFWNISWAWIYALLLFVMVWTLVTIYMSRAKKFDIEAEKIVAKYKGGSSR